jgi:hypothetical protein
MTTVIKPKRSETLNAVPLPGQLEIGELAINITDGKLFTKKSDGSIKELGGAGAVSLQAATTSGNVTTNDIVLNGSNLVFEGSVNDAFETTLTVENPTADRTITIPNQSGALAMDGDSLAYSIVFGS